MDLLPLVCLCLLTWSGTTFADGNGERVTVTEGSDVILPCFLNENLVPMGITWEKEESLMKKLVFKYNNRRHSNNGLTGQDEEFKGRVFHFRDKLGDGDASIRIVNTKITDSGNYTCNIPNRKLFRIELVVGESKMIVSEDSDVILPCFLNNDNLEKKEFVWKKNGQKVVFHYNNSEHSNNLLIGQDKHFNGRVSYFPKELKNGSASIEIKSTKKDDGGNYTCTIQGKQESFIKLVVDLILKDRTDENLPGAAPEPIIEILGETKNGVKVMCVVGRASPKPDVQWQDSAGNTLTAEEQKVTRNGDIILTATVTKTDNYTCVATQKDIHHQIQSMTHVTVPGLKDRRNEIPGFPGWAWFFIGVAVCVVIGIAAWKKDYILEKIGCNRGRHLVQSEEPAVNLQTIVT